MISTACSSDLHARVHHVLSVTSARDAIVNIELNDDLFSVGLSILNVLSEATLEGPIFLSSTRHSVSIAGSMSSLSSFGLVVA